MKKHINLDHAVMMGQVTSITPVEVRFYGSSVSVPVSLKDATLTLATTDKVLLARTGTDSWVVVCKVGAA